MISPKASRGRQLVWSAVLLLFILHHDFWWWADPRLVFGFLPIGLAYHMVFSIAVAAVWLGALKFAWPEELEKWADETATGEERQ
jgi:hypothetical protein